MERGRTLRFKNIERKEKAKIFTTAALCFATGYLGALAVGFATEAALKKVFG